MIPLAISTVDIVLLVALVIVGALAAAGRGGAPPPAPAGAGKLHAELAAAEGARAPAHASDKGWDRELLEAAAREAFAQRFGTTPISAMQLVQVLDRPGTDADQAVFRVLTADGEEHRITLGRSGGVWGHP